jgi:hypothetical protein
MQHLDWYQYLYTEEGYHRPDLNHDSINPRVSCPSIPPSRQQFIIVIPRYLHQYVIYINLRKHQFLLFSKKKKYIYIYIYIYPVLSTRAQREIKTKNKNKNYAILNLELTSQKIERRIYLVVLFQLDFTYVFCTYVYMYGQWTCMHLS